MHPSVNMIESMWKLWHECVYAWFVSHDEYTCVVFLIIMHEILRIKLNVYDTVKPSSNKLV